MNTPMSDSASEINSIEDAIALVRWERGFLDDLNEGIRDYRRVFPRGTWFRGQENSTWELVPSVFRRIDGELVYGESEPTIVSDFKLRYAARQADMSDSLDWLCLMQHHSCPTRILDFTENVLIALYFAVRDNPKENGSAGALFVLNSIKLNHQTAGGPTHLRADDFPCWLRSQQAEDITLDAISVEIATSRPGDLPQFTAWLAEDRKKWAEYLARPIAAWPRAIHDRMIRQQSVFTVFGGTYAAQDGDIPTLKALEDLNGSLSSGWQFLKKFEIPASRKEPIRCDLQAVGIHVASLFPEMEYQAAFIRDSHKAQITR
jgi:hypothetical protein